jgi:hypothetical protein
MISLRRTTMHARSSFAALVLATVATSANAAPCAGFTDVDTSSSFCKNVEWIKNRGVTLGCTSATLYCPTQSVSRLQMAAFMNRLGTALTPILLKMEVASGALNLDQTPVVCATADQPIVDYPRRALVDAALSGNAAAGVDIGVRGVYSTNLGASWQPLSTVPGAAFVAAAQWGQASDVGTLDLNVGQTVRFGVQASRVSAGATNLSDSRCVLRVQIGGRDGTTSPL